MAAKGILLPVAGVPRLSQAEEDALVRAARAGGRLVALLRDGPPEPALEAAAKWLFRRWLLEVLVVLRGRGPLGFNAIAREIGGPASESLAPKLRDLESFGVVTRSEIGGSPRRVLYALTPHGTALAAGVFGLTAAKAEQMRGIVAPAEATRLVLPRSERGDPRAALETFFDAAVEFTEARLSRVTGADVEAAVDAARRFSKACVRRWHGDVVTALVAAGPLRYSELRAQLGIGDQALAAALRGLETLRMAERVGSTWAATETARFDLAFGAPLVARVAALPKPLAPI